MKNNNGKKLNVVEGNRKKIIVITDMVSRGCYERGMVMTVPALNLFSREAEDCGFDKEDFVFINPCPPVPKAAQSSDGNTAKYMADYREETMALLGRYFEDGNSPKAILTLGKWGLRQLYGKSVLITKARGTIAEQDITLSDGKVVTVPVLPLLSPKEVLRFPEKREIYNTDFTQLRAFENNGWQVEAFRGNSEAGFKWCMDLKHWLKNPPKCIFADLETVGVETIEKDFRILTFAFTTKAGVAHVVPLDLEWWNNPERLSKASAAMPRLTEKKRTKLLKQIRKLVGNVNVHCVGHNFKFDIHGLHGKKIEVANWYADTMQLAFVVDENMQSKTQDDCVRRWLPQHAGYADEFNENVDKSRMDLVNHDDFLGYAGGDVAYGFPLANRLLREAKRDARQWDTFVRIQMPVLRTFVQMERAGVRIDTEALASFGQECKESEAALYAELMRDIPAEVLRKHADKGWSFARHDFVIDVLFGPDAIRVKENGKLATGKKRKQKGERLKPLVFTKSGKISVSSKQHFPYFSHVDFVTKLIRYQQLSKMRSTYVGEDKRSVGKPVKKLKLGGLPKAVRDKLIEVGVEPPVVTAKRKRTPIPDLVEFCKEWRAKNGRDADVPVKELDAVIPFKKGGELRITPFAEFTEMQSFPETGFWQYLKNRDLGTPAIHPSFWVHRTNTGRAASSNPNGQNFPKRGPLAKAYRKIFIPRPGYKFIECDLSQAELRIAAWMANETEMQRIYRMGGDIHAATAAAVMGVSEQKFLLGLNDESLLVDVVNDWPGAGQYLKQFPRSKWNKIRVGRADVRNGEYSFLSYKRQGAKSVNFGFIYGMGWRKFKVFAKTDYGIDYTDEEAEAVRVAFFKKYPRLVRWHRQMRDYVAKHGYVRALHGALRRLDNIESDDDMIVGATSRQAINAPVQRFASDIGLIALCRFVRDANPDDMRPVLFIHDANIIEAREEIVEEAASALRFYTETPPLQKWFNLRAPLPIVADVSIGDNLGEMVERPDIAAIEPSWYQRGEEPPTMAKAVQEAWVLKKRRGIVLTD